jgi:hypothetical protein
MWGENFDVKILGKIKNPMRQGSDVARQLTLLFHIGFKRSFLILISFYLGYAKLHSKKICPLI